MQDDTSSRYRLVSGKTLIELATELENLIPEYSRVLYIDKKRGEYTALVDTYPMLVITPDMILLDDTQRDHKTLLAMALSA